MSRIFAAAALVASASAMRSGNGTGNVPVVRFCVRTLGTRSVAESLDLSRLQALYSESKCPDCAAFAPTFDAVWKLECVCTGVLSLIRIQGIH